MHKEKQRKFQVQNLPSQTIGLLCSTWTSPLFLEYLYLIGTSLLSETVYHLEAVQSTIIAD
jgi:hypothetical protein